MDGLARLVERVFTFGRPEPEDAEAFVARTVSDLEALVAQAKRCTALALATEKMMLREGMSEPTQQPMSEALKELKGAIEAPLAEARRWQRLLPARRDVLREGERLCSQLGAKGEARGLAQLSEDLQMLEQELQERLASDPRAGAEGR
jgi:hypothetical protein